MEMAKAREFEIKISIQDGEIRLGRNHAIAAFPDEAVVWTCPEHAFAVQFSPDAPFEVANGGNRSVLKRTRNVPPSQPFKYTIAVYDEKIKKVLILDPVYIEIPPRG